MDKFNCPYCGELYDDMNQEYFDEFDSSTTINCPCGKVFFVEREFSVHYEVSKIPCQDGEPHNFSKIIYLEN